MVSLWREREENKERQEAGYAPEGKPCDGVNSILFSCKVRKALCHLLYLMFCFYARIPFALTFDVSGKPDTPFSFGWCYWEEERLEIMKSSVSC